MIYQTESPQHPCVQALAVLPLLWQEQHSESSVHFLWPQDGQRMWSRICWTPVQIAKHETEQKDLISRLNRFYKNKLALCCRWNHPISSHGAFDIMFFYAFHSIWYECIRLDIENLFFKMKRFSWKPSLLYWWNHFWSPLTNFICFCLFGWRNNVKRLNFVVRCLEHQNWKRYYFHVRAEFC